MTSEIYLECDSKPVYDSVVNKWFCITTMKVNGVQCCLGTNVLQKIIFCVFQNIETHTD